MNAIRHIRKSIFQVTQAEFAAIANVTQATVSRWEDDENGATPSLGEMGAIRAAAIERNLGWDDRVFFETPGQDQAAA
jgi:transcriptional regulator with XRE-family HTH domain